MSVSPKYYNVLLFLLLIVSRSKCWLPEGRLQRLCKPALVILHKNIPNSVALRGATISHPCT